MNALPALQMPSRPATTVRGTTLIEMLIAMVVLVTLTVIVLQSLIAAQRWRTLAAAEDDINRAAAEAFNVMSVDLAESGWWFPNLTQLPNDIGLDRTSRYFPYVQMQSINGLAGSRGAEFSAFWRPETVVRMFPGPGDNGRPDIIARLPGNVDDCTIEFGVAARQAYLASFFARSQELIFLKQTTSGWEANPSQRALPTLRFPEGDWSTPSMTDYSTTGMNNRAALGILMPSGWREVSTNVYERRPYDANGDGVVGSTEGLVAGNHVVPYGVPLHTAKLDSTAGVALRNNWETMAVANYDGSLPQQDFREYGYVVVPSPLGLGRLVRVYSLPNAQAAGLAVGTDPGQRLLQATATAPFQLVVDRVLAEHVVRIICDTYRTDPDLLINEVRVRLYMAREVPTDNMFIVNRVVESILIMRAKAATAIDAADSIQAVGAVQLAY